MKGKEFKIFLEKNWFQKQRASVLVAFFGTCGYLGSQLRGKPKVFSKSSALKKILIHASLNEIKLVARFKNDLVRLETPFAIAFLGLFGSADQFLNARKHFIEFHAAVRILLIETC